MFLEVYLLKSNRLQFICSPFVYCGYKPRHSSDVQNGKCIMSHLPRITVWQNLITTAAGIGTHLRLHRFSSETNGGRRFSSICTSTNPPNQCKIIQASVILLIMMSRWTSHGPKKARPHREPIQRKWAEERLDTAGSRLHRCCPDTTGAAPLRQRKQGSAWDKKERHRGEERARERERVWESEREMAREG